MAKYCGNCGTQLEDSAKVCGQCGTPLDGASLPRPKVKVIDPEKQKKAKRAVKLIASLVVLVAVVSVATNVISRYTGYNGLIRKVMVAYEDYDIDTLISLSSDMYYYGVEDWVEHYFEYTVGNSLDYFESAVGHKYKLSYEVIEIYEVSERKLSETLDTIKNTYSGFDVSMIKDIVVAEVTIVAKQGSTSVSRNINITMSKENGSWKVLYIDQ